MQVFLCAPSVGPYLLQRGLKYGSLSCVRFVMMLQRVLRIPTYGSIRGPHGIHFEHLPLAERPQIPDFWTKRTSHQRIPGTLRPQFSQVLRILRDIGILNSIPWAPRSVQTQRSRELVAHSVTVPLKAPHILTFGLCMYS